MTYPTIGRYIALGDGLSKGVSDWGQGKQTIGFVYRLAELLRAGAPGCELRNLAAERAQTSDVLLQQLEPALAANPELVTLTVGIDDIPGTPLEQFQRNYNALLARLRSGTSAIVAVANIPEFAHLLPDQFVSIRVALRERVRTFNRIIAELATAYGVVLVDLHDAAELYDPRSLSDDGVHPNARGYHVITRAFVMALNQASFGLTLPPVDPIALVE